MESEEVVVYATKDRFSEEHFTEICQIIEKLPEICIGNDDSIPVACERSLERCVYILDLYQEQPHLLDPKIPAIVDRLLTHLRRASTNGNRRLFYQCFHHLRWLIKVRGYKSFGRFLPHEHGDLIPVLRMLEEELKINVTIKNEADVCIAEYVLLIWIAMLCKIPFDFSRFDYATDDSTPAKSTSQRIYDAVKPCLITHDQRREAAAFCLSTFVSRPDSVRRYLRTLIFDDILRLFADAKENYANVEARYDIGLEFIISGYCLLLAGLLKRIKREEITQEWSHSILEQIFSSPAIFAESPNILIRKLATKIVVRSALTMLKPQIAPWRYERGSRSLAANLTSDEPAVGTTIASTTSYDKEMDEAFEIPEDTESVINYLLTALKDKDTVCRWSSAKGFGRLCARLPQSLADQIVTAILTYFQDDFADASRHGACLALAELGRRGLLLPSRLSEVVPIVVQALTYDEQRGTYSVGSNVRDAACYVCWSFARAYAPAELRPYNLQLAIGLLTTAVYDREVNCRRAASAAFQEHVGRQRGEFPHGIDLLTAVDYFAVGNRKHCYKELSVFVAKHPEYTHAMIDHLIEQKVIHWDEQIRDLAGHALHRLSQVDPAYVVSNVIPKMVRISDGHDLFACHGAIIALGRSAAATHERLPDTVVTDLFNVPQRIIASRLFKGVGGELMRKSLNDVVFNLSQFITQRISDSDAVQRYVDVYKTVMDENLSHQREDIRRGAHKASKALFASVPPSVVGVENYFQRLEKATYERERMGACQALSALPRSAIMQNRSTIFQILVKYSTSGVNKRTVDSLWASARRDCVSALTSIVKHLDIDLDDGLTAAEFETVIQCYLNALDDYTTDSRGDIGAYVREAAISGLKELYSALLSSTSNRLIVDIDKSRKVIGKILQQCCEKIDRTRELACENMEALVKEAGSADRLSSILKIPRPDVLTGTFASEESIDWTKASQSYPRLIDLMNAGEVYAYPVLLGFAVTVGGMTESTVRASADALLDYVGRIQSDHDRLRLIVSTLVSIFQDHRKLERVTIPLMKMIDRIFTCNYLDDYVTNGGDETTLEKLLDLSIAETKYSKNAQKVLVGLTVCNCYLRYEGSAVAAKALKYAISMLVHVYPHVRREAASRLYESVLSYFSLDNHSEQVLTLLSETDWDSEPGKLVEVQKELELMLKVK